MGYLSGVRDVTGSVAILRTGTRAAGVAGALILVGCDIIAVCDTAVDPALQIEVVDARTGAWKADSATGWAQRQGAPSEPLRLAAWRVGTTGDTITHLGVNGTGSGQYTIHLTRNGYRNWDRQGVVVKSGACGVETTHLTAALEPTP